MTYEETIETIHSFQQFGSKLGLERIARLMELLGNPQEQMKVIHVGGTNGKGSVCRYLYAVLQEHGYRVGIYTSPYLQRFSERMECDGKEISPEELVQCTEIVLTQVERLKAEGGGTPTEFELITAIAFVYFFRQQTEVLVLEVGLGGSGDSTNVVNHPLISIITSISFDHMDYLGHTLTQIAEQKAGIIKSGVPVVFHVEEPSAAEVIIEAAKQKRSEVYSTFSVEPRQVRKTMAGYTFDVTIGGTVYEQLSLSMIGMHQVFNAICALTALEVLKKKGHLQLEKEQIYNGMKKARHTGRFEVMREKPCVILDGAHNEAGAQSLQKTLQDHFTGQKIRMVIGVLADKKADRLIKKFGMIADTFIATEPDNPRKLSAAELCSQVEATGKQCSAVPAPEEALRIVLESSKDEDVIVFAGSLYLIGKIRELMEHEEK